MILPPFLKSTLSATALLAGCATPPLALDARHPASAEASETPQPARHALRDDPNSARTRALLAERDAQAKSAAAETPNAEEGQ